jgi:hypothetical protein
MATQLKSDFPAIHSDAPPLNLPKTAEMRRAERQMLKAARIRARAALAEQRKNVTRQVHSHATSRHDEIPGYSARVVKAMLRRWFGDRMHDVPLVMTDYRYWQARSAGFDPQPGRDLDGVPAGELCEWYARWWCPLRFGQRAQLIRMNRACGVVSLNRRRV